MCLCEDGNCVCATECFVACLFLSVLRLACGQALLAYRPRHPDASKFFSQLDAVFARRDVGFSPATDRGVTIFELTLR